MTRSDRRSLLLGALLTIGAVVVLTGLGRETRPAPSPDAPHEITVAGTSARLPADVGLSPNPVRLKAKGDHVAAKLDQTVVVERVLSSDGAAVRGATMELLVEGAVIARAVSDALGEVSATFSPPLEIVGGIAVTRGSGRLVAMRPSRGGPGLPDRRSNACRGSTSAT